MAPWQAPQPPDSFSRVLRRNFATKVPPAAAGRAESASSVFNRSRIDISRQVLKIAQTATMSPARSDSAAMSACSESYRDVVSDE